VVNDGGKLGLAASEVGRSELAFEDGVLEVIAVVAHGLEDLPQALVIANVVADEVRGTHGNVVVLVGEGLKWAAPSSPGAMPVTISPPLAQF
jgi:hypothetical protein